MDNQQMNGQQRLAVMIATEADTRDYDLWLLDTHRGVLIDKNSSMPWTATISVYTGKVVSHDQSLVDKFVRERAGARYDEIVHSDSEWMMKAAQRIKDYQDGKYENEY